MCDYGFVNKILQVHQNLRDTIQKVRVASTSSFHVSIYTDSFVVCNCCIIIWSSRVHKSVMNLKLFTTEVLGNKSTN